MQERSQSTAIGILILAALGVLMAWYWPTQKVRGEAPIATETPAPAPATPIATLAPLAGAGLVTREPHLVQQGETILSIGIALLSIGIIYLILKGMGL